MARWLFYETESMKEKVVLADLELVSWNLIQGTRYNYEKPIWSRGRYWKQNFPKVMADAKKNTLWDRSR
jgi:hypothetical protein